MNKIIIFLHNHHTEINKKAVNNHQIVDVSRINEMVYIPINVALNHCTNYRNDLMLVTNTHTIRDTTNQNISIVVTVDIGIDNDNLIVHNDALDEVIHIVAIFDIITNHGRFN